MIEPRKIVQVTSPFGVFLERCEDQANPAYIVRGKTMCLRCSSWCWLGSQTMRVVEAGEAAPYCARCFPEMFPDSGPEYVYRLWDR